jgi:hypothetical protein
MPSSLCPTGKNNLQSRYGVNTLSRQKNENYGFEATVIRQRRSHIRGKLWLKNKIENNKCKIDQRRRCNLD